MIVHLLWYLSDFWDQKRIPKDLFLCISQPKLASLQCFSGSQAASYPGAPRDGEQHSATLDQRGHRTLAHHRIQDQVQDHLRGVGGETGRVSTQADWIFYLILQYYKNIWRIIINSFVLILIQIFFFKIWYKY